MLLSPHTNAQRCHNGGLFSVRSASHAKLWKMDITVRGRSNAATLVAEAATGLTFCSNETRDCALLAHRYGEVALVHPESTVFGLRTYFDVITLRRDPCCVCTFPNGILPTIRAPGFYFAPKRAPGFLCISVSSSLSPPLSLSLLFNYTVDIENCLNCMCLGPG